MSMTTRLASSFLSICCTSVLYAQATNTTPWQEEVQAAWQLQGQSRFAEAAAHADRAWEALRREPDYAPAVQSVAQFWQSQGEFLRAESLYKTAIGRIGENRSGRVALGIALSQLYLGEQRAVKAVRVLEELAASMNRMQPGDATNVLSSLASAYESSGRMLEAEETWKRMNGYWNLLADFYARHGRREEAEKSYRQALAEAEAKGPAAIPQLMGLLQQMSWFYRAGKQWSEAEELTKRMIALNGQGAPFENQPLIDLYLDAGRNDDANRLLNEGLTAIERQNGRESPAYRAALNTWAGALLREKRFDEAEKAIQDYMSGAADNAAERQSGLWQLAQLYGERGDQAKAEEMRAEAARLQRGLNDESDPRGAVLMAQEAAAASNRGEKDRARQLADDAVEAARSAGSNACGLMSGVANPVVFNLAAQDAERAEQIAQQAVRECEQAAGPRHSNTLSALDLLATLLGNAQHWQEADRIVRRKMALIAEAKGEDSPALTAELERLATLAQEAGLPAQAEQFYAESLRISDAERGTRNPALIQSLMAFAGFYLATDQAERAGALFERAAAISEQTQEPIAHAWLLAQIGQARAGSGAWKSANHWFQKAVAVAREAKPYAAGNVEGIEQNYKAMLAQRQQAEVKDGEPMDDGDEVE